MTNRFFFRNDVLDELGLEIEWCGHYLNLVRDGKHIDCRSYHWDKIEVSYYDILPLIEEWTNDLLLLLEDDTH